MHPACQFHSDKPWLDKQFHDAEQTSIKKPDELVVEIRDPGSELDEELFDRILGSMTGLLLGDALGAHVEFRPHDFLVDNPVTELQGGGTWGLQKGQFTDDTSMALCLAISLVARRGFVAYDQLVRYKWWYKHGYMSSTGLCFDIGSATSQSLNEFEKRQKVLAIEKKIPFEQLDYLSDPELLKDFNIFCSQEGAAGNGALMRLAPVPLFYHRNPKVAVKNSGISGLITHGDPKAYDSCRYFGAIIVAALQGEPKSSLLDDKFYDNHKDWFDNEPLHPDVQNVAQGSFKRAGGYEDGIRGKGYIINALEAALWAFWSDEDSFEKGVLRAVNLGDDTDTTAAIYGGLAGAHYGYKSLPKRWLDDIYAKNLITCVCKWMTHEAWKPSDIPNPPGCRVSPELVTDRRDSEEHSTSERQHTEEKSTEQHHMPATIIKAPTTMPSMQRTAIDERGSVGSLYDGYRDRLIVPLDTIVKDQQLSVLAKTTKCFVKKGNDRENLNLLQLIGITNELRLSVELNITPAVGIAQAINYKIPIDLNTRFLYYNYLDRDESLRNNVDNINRSIQSTTRETQATHVITGVTWGIEVLTILQLSSDDASKIDYLIDRIRQCLTDNATDLGMTLDEKRLLHSINRTTIYSNIHPLTKITSIIDFCDKIADIRVDRTRHLPLTYTLCPIRFLCPQYLENDVRYIPLEPSIIEKIEFYVLPLSLRFNVLKKLLENKSFHSSGEYLRQQFIDAQSQFSELKATYSKKLKTIQDWIINSRKGKISPNTTLQELTDNHQNELQGIINNIITCLNNLKEKIPSLHDLPVTQNGHDSGKDLHDDKFKYQSTTDEQDENFQYSTDASENKFGQNSSILDTRKTYHESSFPYSDVFDRLPRSHNARDVLSNDEIRTVYEPHSETSRLSSTYPKVSSLSATEKIINILLLGEIGVGKSTFINAFANYCSFETLDDTRFHKPILVIPSSFVMTTQDWSATPMHVLAGSSDPDEKHDNYYHSTTQRCKSYLFHTHDGAKIRFIDTPGLGNLCGWHRDHLEMQTILSFINNFSHLDAVCLLLKPNFSRFSIYNSCFQHLFSFFGEHIRRNIIFCFTNSFSTRFDPSDGIRLFESELKSVFQLGIRMNQENTFNFDSESFRYIVALQNSLEFNSGSMYQVKFSWSKSKIESMRFLRYIKNQLNPIQIHGECLSLKHAQLEIQCMIRPILETMRNMLRNYILYTRMSPNASIELCSKTVVPNTALCTSCHSYSVRVGKILIGLDTKHKLDQNQCYSCTCSLKRHIPIDHELDYKFSLDRQKYNASGTADILELIKRSVYLAKFLLYYSNNAQDDSFLSGIDRMIHEEYFIYSHFIPSDLNYYLYRSLKDLKRHYQQDMEKISIKQRDRFDLSRINADMKYISELSTINEQMNAIKQSRELFIINHEKQVQLQNGHRS
ncbi:unnamed protein product [Rotaria socialis]|uniref:Uncharacterized protein n=2 Tax=Rotaria socialis TaxID=392032 RepID=A0A821ATI1_9BILA|nr:unnamed protein product [Rotaria socialis]